MQTAYVARIMGSFLFVNFYYLCPHRENSIVIGV